MIFLTADDEVMCMAVTSNNISFYHLISPVSQVPFSLLFKGQGFIILIICPNVKLDLVAHICLKCSALSNIAAGHPNHFEL